MDCTDDVDEDELALAMSTELSRPARALSGRRTRSFTSLRDAEVSRTYSHNVLTSRSKSIPPFSDHKDALTTQKLNQQDLNQSL